MMEGVRGILAVWSCLPCRIFLTLLRPRSAASLSLAMAPADLIAKKVQEIFF